MLYIFFVTFGSEESCYASRSYRSVYEPIFEHCCYLLLSFYPIKHFLSVLRKSQTSQVFLFLSVMGNYDRKMSTNWKLGIGHWALGNGQWAMRIKH
ncbi:MAG: hypothetical protein KME22_00780 [Hassallia sp. WJT32-NPBG1]|jgi:hypothetical protein|nr:hypothetical protein [Hassallia sp. WJT32-NPBG1]